jgi:hypothetical protein
MTILKKGMINMKILKKRRGGSREKGEEEAKSMPSFIHILIIYGTTPVLSRC